MNNIKYWKKNQNLRVAESLVDLVEENSKSPSKKIFVKYKNPIINAVEHNKLLSNIRKQTEEMREKLRKQ